MEKKVAIIKLLSLISTLALLIWFTFDMTGFGLGNFLLVTSAFVDEPIDAAWWIIFIGVLILFIIFSLLHEKNKGAIGAECNSDI